MSLFESDLTTLMKRGLLTAKNSHVDDINNLLIKKFPGDILIYTSTDRTLDTTHQADYEDFLNALQPNGMPPYILKLKENCPVMLLCNIDPTERFCNGTRLVCKKLKPHIVCAEITVGERCGKPNILHPISLILQMMRNKKSHSSTYNSE